MISYICSYFKYIQKKFFIVTASLTFFLFSLHVNVIETFVFLLFFRPVAVILNCPFLPCTDVRRWFYYALAVKCIIVRWQNISISSKLLIIYNIAINLFINPIAIKNNRRALYRTCIIIVIKQMLAIRNNGTYSFEHFHQCV